MDIYVNKKFNFIKEIDKSSPIHKGTLDIKISSRHHSKNTIHYIYNSNNNIV